MLAHLKIWPVEGKNNRKGKGVDWKSIVSKESSSVTDILIEIPCIVARKKSMHTNPNFTQAAIYPIYPMQRQFRTCISVKSLAVVLPTCEAAKAIMVAITISLWFNQSIKKFQKLVQPLRYDMGIPLCNSVGLCLSEDISSLLLLWLIMFLLLT